MAPLYYVMAILGCGEGETACEPVATVARYESAQACNADAEAALQAHGDILYPVVVAQCRQEGSRIAGKVMPSEVKLPAPREPEVRRASYGKPRPARG